MILKHLQQNHNFKFLFTRRLNTDPLENVFGTVRQQGGNSDNPTPFFFYLRHWKLHSRRFGCTFISVFKQVYQSCSSLAKSKPTNTGTWRNRLQRECSKLQYGTTKCCGICSRISQERSLSP